MKLPRLNTLLGALLAPLAPGILLVLLAAFLGRLSEGLFMLLGSVMLTYPAMLVVGLPIHLAYSLLGMVRIWPYLIAGLFTGAIVGWVMNPVQTNWALPAFIGACGAVTSAAFWILIRPDRRMATRALAD